jgi:hypothetical protein
MSARVPLDVDLEDKLLYGLTPTRLAYLVLSLLCGFALWSSAWAPQPVRVAASITVIGLGAALAWGRWRSRAADLWLADMAIFAIRRYRVIWTPRRARRMESRSSS